MAKRRMKLVPLSKPTKQRTRWSVIRVVTWVFGTGIPFILTYAGAIAFWPCISVAVREPLDKRDALSARFEISNNSFFALKNLELNWEARSATNSELHASLNRVGFATPPLKIESLKPTESAPMMPPTREIFGASFDGADVILSVTYQTQLLSLQRHQSFRFVSEKTLEGEILWYRRPLD